MTRKARKRKQATASQTISDYLLSYQRGMEMQKREWEKVLLVLRGTNYDES